MPLGDGQKEMEILSHDVGGGYPAFLYVLAAYQSATKDNMIEIKSAVKFSFYS